MKTQNNENQKQKLVEELVRNSDLLIGSVVAYQLKCSKNCTCNDGKGHTKFYLSTKVKGRTRNLCLTKEALSKARQMTDAHRQMKNILQQLSQVNYQLLRQQFPPRRSRKNKHL
jgi:hypothetical protein